MIESGYDDIYWDETINRWHSTMTINHKNYRKVSKQLIVLYRWRIEMLKRGKKTKRARTRPKRRPCNCGSGNLRKRLEEYEKRTNA